MVALQCMTLTLTYFHQIESWMPHGYGKPTLYRLSVSYLENDLVAFTKDIKIGFRSVSLVEDDLQSGGKSWRFPQCTAILNLSLSLCFDYRMQVGLFTLKLTMFLYFLRDQIGSQPMFCRKLSLPITFVTFLTLASTPTWILSASGVAVFTNWMNFTRQFE